MALRTRYDDLQLNKIRFQEPPPDKLSEPPFLVGLSQEQYIVPCLTSLVLFHIILVARL